MPFGTKVLINAGLKIILGTTDISKDFQEAIQKANEDVAQNTGKWIAKKFEDYESEKTSFIKYRESLEKFCLLKDKPVVIFIDELDRCKPTFAVQLIERIKHLFDVPNLIFVLLINKEQLENAIKGVYGHETDAAKYLGKFVNFFFRLPRGKNLAMVSLRNNKTKDFIEDVMKRYKFDSSQQILCTNLNGAVTSSQIFANYL